MSVGVCGDGACPESSRPHRTQNRDIYGRRRKMQETLYIGQWLLSPLQVGPLGPHAVIPASSATAARCSFCSGGRSHRMDFATTRLRPRSCVKILDTVVLGVPRSCPVPTLSATGLCWSQPHTCVPQSQVLCLLQAFRNAVTFDRFPAILAAFAPHFYLCCTHCSVPESFLSHPHRFRRGMFKLNAKLNADSLLSSLSHSECDGHTVHMLTQWHLPPPLTSTVKSSLFTHAYPSPLSLAARSHRCLANYFRYTNNGWTFPRHTLNISTNRK